MEQAAIQSGGGGDPQAVCQECERLKAELAALNREYGNYMNKTNEKITRLITEKSRLEERIKRK